MCLFRSKKSSGSYTPPTTQIANTDTSLPSAQTVVPEQPDTSLAYGSKKAGDGQQQRQNAQSLAINLPNAQQGGAQQAGLNTTTG